MFSHIYCMRCDGDVVSGSIVAHMFIAHGIKVKPVKRKVCKIGDPRDLGSTFRLGSQVKLLQEKEEVIVY